MPLLKTEQNTPEMDERVKDAFCAWWEEVHGPPGERDAWPTTFYEHGQWWIRLDHPDWDKPKQFSVIDAEGKGTVDGFDFEEI